MYLLDAGGPLLLIALIAPLILAAIAVVGVIILTITLINRHAKKKLKEKEDDLQ